MCGYRRKTNSQNVPTSKISVVLQAIDNRLEQLKSTSLQSAYSKQKCSLRTEFEKFLASLPNSKTILSASPTDINRFLAWKDRHDKTVVHNDGCSDSHLQSTAKCKCPKRLAFKTVDSYIGKLRAIFKETGRGGKWNSMLGLGNPAASPEVQKYLKHQQRNNFKPASRQSKQSPYSCQNCCFWPVFWIGKSPRTQLILLVCLFWLEIKPFSKHYSSAVIVVLIFEWWKLRKSCVFPRTMGCCSIMYAGKL